MTKTVHELLLVKVLIVKVNVQAMVWYAVLINSLWTAEVASNFLIINQRMYKAK